MFKPRESRTKRIARFVIRTHAVPAIASTNGSAMSATAISAMPIHLAAGFWRSADSGAMATKCFGNADERRCSADERTSKAKYDSANLQAGMSEIQQETQLQIGRAEIVQALLAMDLFDADDRLDFDNQ